MDDVTAVGRNVRRLRHQRQFSLGALATEAGLAKQTVANLERGTGNPTVETLLSVARALGVGINWLVTEWGSPVIVRRHTGAPWNDVPSGRQRTLDEIHGTGQVKTAIIELVGGRRTVTPALTPGTLHHAYVVSGTVLAGPATEPETLNAGDFIRFPADVPHLLSAPTHDALVHIVTTIAQVQQFSPS